MNLKALLISFIGLAPYTVFGQELSETSLQTLGRPLTYRVGQEILFDSNVLRLPDGQAVPTGYSGNKRSDVFSRTFGGVNFSNNIASQNLQLDLNVEVRKYASYSSLDRNTFGFVGSIGGDLNRAWYYELGLNSSSVAGDFINQIGFEPNVVRSTGATGRLGYRFTPSWAVYGAMASSDRTNSAATLAPANTSQSTVELGIRFEPESGLSSEIGLSHRKVKYPNRQSFDTFGSPLPISVSNSFQTDQLVGRVSYRPTGQIIISGNIGIGNTRFDELNQRNSNSLLLGLDCRYVFSDLAEVGFQLARDLGAGAASFSSPVLSTRIGANATWRPTGRLSVSASLNNNARRFTLDPGVVVGTNTAKQDNLKAVGLSAKYEVSRTVNLNAGFNYQSRSADVKAFSFTGNVINLGMIVNFD